MTLYIVTVNNDDTLAGFEFTDKSYDKIISAYKKVEDHMMSEGWVRLSKYLYLFNVVKMNSSHYNENSLYANFIKNLRETKLNTLL